jgi:hypothetical protein
MHFVNKKTYRFYKLVIKVKFACGGGIENQAAILLIPEKDFALLGGKKKEELKLVRSRVDAELFGVTRETQPNIKAFKVTSLKRIYPEGVSYGYVFD